MAITAIVVAGILYLGRAWWGAEANNYQRNVNIFKPPAAETKLENGNRLVIRPKGQDPEWSKYVKMEEVIPDHGHLMHLFAISAAGLDRMWHLHPGRIAGGAFVEELPSMPAGRYQIFGDIVDKHGFPWTMVGSIDLAEINGQALRGDDSAWAGAAVAVQAEDSTVSPLADGGRMVWRLATDPLKANVPMDFKFSVEDKDGQPARDLEPYMGMAGHAEFVSTDMSVFAHVHPAGSVSMAALELARTGSTRASCEFQTAIPPYRAIARPSSRPPLPPEVSFPSVFPPPGAYPI